MIEYNKNELAKVSGKYGFVRDTFEKVLRLTEVLRFFSDEILSQHLILKGGTAINLALFDLPRLSVDIDLDYVPNSDRDEMLKNRTIITDKITAYMQNEGYALSPNSRFFHSLDGLLFTYTNAGGRPDVIKVETNYSLREHVFDPVNKEIAFMSYDDVTKKYELKSQMRCQGGDAYIDYVKRIFNGRPEKFEPVMNYDFRLFDDVDEMVSEIKRLNEEYGLCRNVAGYSWKWVTDIRKPLCRDRGIKTYEQIRDAGLYDIDICGHKYIWNLKTEGWILREDAVNTIGCIHTTQGFDLNCVGVIFGEEIDYDPRKMEITVDLEKFHDTNVKRGTDPDVVKQYVINTYVTMMARGIHGCYVYACNKNLREYLAEFIPKHNMK